MQQWAISLLVGLCEVKKKKKNLIINKVTDTGQCCMLCVQQHLYITSCRCSAALSLIIHACFCF